MPDPEVPEVALVKAILERIKAGENVILEPDWGGYSTTITVVNEEARTASHTHVGMDTSEYDEVVEGLLAVLTGGPGLSCGTRSASRTGVPPVPKVSCCLERAEAILAVAAAEKIPYWKAVEKVPSCADKHPVRIETTFLLRRIWWRILGHGLRYSRDDPATWRPGMLDIRPGFISGVPEAYRITHVTRRRAPGSLDDFSFSEKYEVWAKPVTSYKRAVRAVRREERRKKRAEARMWRQRRIEKKRAWRRERVQAWLKGWRR